MSTEEILKVLFDKEVVMMSSERIIEHFAYK
jgi:hypothetical protein